MPRASSVDARTLSRLAWPVPELALALATELPVLLSLGTAGERYLGAWAIHECGPRRRHAWVAIRATPEVLVSSDGRLVNLPSAHADARGGTLFLDAVWALDEAQQRLFLDLISMDTPRTVRLIVGSDRYLWPLVESGYFSEALFYRLNALHITRAAARPWS